MANNKTTIKVQDIKTIVDMIFAHIKDDLGVYEIELTQDYYWDIPEKFLYLTEQDSHEFVIGSLFEDLEFLKPLLSDKDQAVSLMFTHVAPLLRYIATKVGQ